MNRELDATLAELAARLGVAAEDLWPLLVGHAFWSCVVAVVGAVAVMILLLALTPMVWRRSQEASDRAGSLDKEMAKFIPRLAMGVLLCSWALVTFVAIAEMAPGLLYPEAVALSRLF